jgi:hypothetical protein
MRLVIVGCGKKKIWDRYPDAGPTPAKDAYVGPYFKLNRRYAEHLGYDWLVLSAKYGFIRPDFVIPDNYNVTFKDQSTHPVSTDELRRQLFQLQLGRYDLVTILGGQDYIGRVEEAFARMDARFETPFAGPGMGEQMAMIKAILIGDDATHSPSPVCGVSPKRARTKAVDREPRSTNIPNADTFRHTLSELLSSSKGQYVDVVACELHDLVGTRSGKDSRMPTCCNVMLAAMQNGDTVLASPPRGRGASLTIRYRLPR